MSDTIPNPKNQELTSDLKIELNGFPLELGKKLGEGATAIVFQGTYKQQKVAIKAMRPGIGKAMEDLFRSEAEHLRLLRKGWETEYPNEPLAIPVLEGEGTYHGQPYLVMEFMQGVPLDEILESEANLEEKDGLALMTQFGRILVVLHERLQKCYSDIKLDNLWLLNQRDAKGLPALKVTDWNVIAEKDEESVRTDLFYSSLFLFRILTRSVIPYRGIQITTRLDQNPAFAKLSLASQRFLRNALHPNLARRYSTAREWTERVGKLRDLWLSEAGDLIRQAGDLLSRADTDQKSQNLSEAAEAFNQARETLDISARKGKGNVALWNIYNEQTQEGLEHTNELEHGLRLLRGHDFVEAAKVFRKGAEDSPMQPEGLLRWYWLAMAAYRMGIESFQQFYAVDAQGNQHNRLINGVQALIAGEARQARDILRPVCLQLAEKTPLELSALTNEAQILYLAEEAQSKQQQEDYAGAASSLEQAYQLSLKLPTDPKTNWAESLGDIYQLWQTAKKEAETLGEAQRRCDLAHQAVVKKQWKVAADEFLQAFDLVSDNREVIRLWRAGIQNSFGEGEIAGAMELARPTLQLRDIKQEVMPLWNMALQLTQVGNLTARQETLGSAVELLRQYQDQYQGNSLALGLPFTTTLENAAHSAVRANEIDLAGRLVGMMRQVNPERANILQEDVNSIRQTVSEARQSRMEDLELRIHTLHEKRTLKDSIEACSLIEAYRALVVEGTEIPGDKKAFFDRVDSQQQELQEEARVRAEENKAREKEIISQLDRIDQQIQRRDEIISLLDPSQPGENKIRQELIQERIHQLAGALDLTVAWEQLNPDPQVWQARRKRYHDLLERSGLRAIQESIHYSEGRLQTIRGMLDGAKISYEQGDSDKFKVQLENLRGIVSEADEDYRSLLSKQSDLDDFLVQVRKLRGSPQAENIAVGYPQPNELVEQLLGADVPSIYWKQNMAEIRAPLDQVRERTLQEIRQRKPEWEAPLVKLIKNQQLLARVQSKAKLTPADEGSPTSLGQIVHAVSRIKDAQDSTVNAAVENIMGLINSFPPNKPVSIEALQRERSRIERRKVLNKALVIGGLATAGLIVFGLLIWLVVSQLINHSASTTPTTMVSPTAVIHHFSPTPSLSPTMTPTETPTPTPTPSPVSKFLINDNHPFQGSSPAGVVPVYVLDDPDAEFEPAEGFWKQDLANLENNPYGGGMHYADAVVEGDGPFAVTWTMDMGIEASGLYEIYASDPVLLAHQYSQGCFKAAPYTVTINSVVAVPIAGKSLYFQKYADVQIKDILDWSSLGVYSLTVGDLVSIRWEIPKENIQCLVNSKSNTLGADAILIAHRELPSTDWSITQHLASIKESAGIPEGAVLWGWIDDDQATLLPDGNWEKVAADDTVAGSWNGVSKIDFTDGISASWTLPQPMLAPGKYLVYAWVSDQNSDPAKSQFIVKVNKKASDPIYLDPSSGARGTLIKLAEVELKDTDPAESLQVIMKPQSDVKSGTFAADAILVFLVP